MSLFTCCLWWFVLGALAGWLLSWLLNRRGDLGNRLLDDLGGLDLHPLLQVSDGRGLEI
jgi:uncharacterized membrane protein YeaQ/YmgE (transglycosylase-associated protein family)